MNIETFIPDNVLHNFTKYKNYIIAVLVVVAGLSAFGIFRYFENIKREESAQIALAETLQELQRAQQNIDLWNDVEVAAKTAYRQYKNTNLWPYFLSIQAHALVELNRMGEAIATMQQAVDAIDKKSGLYHIFAIKLARMKLDAQDESIKKQGFVELQQLAQSSQNLQQDEALYYLGDYYKNSSEIANARMTWQELIKKFDSGKVQNPWVNLAQKGIEELR